MVCPHVREITHSLKLVDYLHLHADNQWCNYFVNAIWAAIKQNVVIVLEVLKFDKNKNDNLIHLCFKLKIMFKMSSLVMCF